MKKTVSLSKACFIVVSVLGIAGSLIALGVSRVNPVFLFNGFIGLAFSVAYLYIGITLRNLLVKLPQLIDNMLFASMAYQVIMFCSVYSMSFKLVQSFNSPLHF